jgi:hypothetical protein
MSRGPRRTTVAGIATASPEDVTTMLNQLHTAADIAADHRRALLADAQAHRLARTARLGASSAATTRPPRRGWLRVLPARRAAGTA